MKKIKCTLSPKVLELMHNLNYIVDYSDDGWVMHSEGGWVPLNDVLENLFLGEKEIRDEKRSGRRI